MQETKNKILRRAILGLDDSTSNVPDKITWRDIDKKWQLLLSTGSLPFTILQQANSDDESVLPDSLMREYMDALRWHNKYHS